MAKLLLCAAWLLGLSFGAAADPDPAKWQDVLEEARGETVYFNAWGGAENINAYLEWAGAEMEKRFGVKVVHVKLDDTANAVAKVIAEKAAGKDDGGTVDLIWINGENFASMKQQQLLFAPGWADRLPNWKFVDVEDKPTIETDFTIPTEGLESPWGMAKLVFFHDAAKTDAAIFQSPRASCSSGPRRTQDVSPIRNRRTSLACLSSSRSCRKWSRIGLSCKSP